jgi:hypothetical protein
MHSQRRPTNISYPGPGERRSIYTFTHAACSFSINVLHNCETGFVGNSLDPDRPLYTELLCARAQGSRSVAHIHFLLLFNFCAADVKEDYNISGVCLVRKRQILTRVMDGILPSTFVPGFHDEASVKKMRYARIGNTNMIVSNFGMGGAQFGIITFYLLRHT